MGKPRKQGLEYFTVDCRPPWYNDDRLVILNKRFGFVAETIFFRLLTDLYSVGCCYRWGEFEIEAFAGRHGLQRDLVAEIVQKMIQFGIFNEEVFKATGYLTSKSIQRRVQAVVKLCKRMPMKVPDGVWLLPDPVRVPVKEEIQDEEIPEIEDSIINNITEREKEREKERIRSKSEDTRSISGKTRISSEDTPKELEGYSNSHTLTHSDLRVEFESGKNETFADAVTKSLSSHTNETNQKEKTNSSERARSEAETQKAENLKTDHWLLLANEKLEEPNNQPWTRTNVFMLDGRRPMRDYPDLFWKPQDLAQVLKIWDSTVPKDQWRSGFLTAQDKVRTALKDGKRLESIAIMSWFLTFIKDGLLKSATDQARLTRSLGGVP